MPELPPKTVRETLGSNVRRIRSARMTGREFIAKLEALGVKLLPSGLTAIEKGERRVSTEELLVFAIALNASVIDLLTPEDGSPLDIGEGIEPIPAWHVESWLSGTDPWPPGADVEQFFENASEVRKIKQRNWRRPELMEVSSLESAILGAIEGVGLLNAVEDPKQMAGYLRDQSERVNQYVALLADRIERHGYGG